MERSVSHKDLGDFNLIRSPINMSAFSSSESFDRAGPELGEHNDEVLLEAGLTTKEIEALRDALVI